MILFAPFVRIYFQRKKNKKPTKKIKISNSSKKADRGKTSAMRLRSVALRYFNGFIRYWNIQIGQIPSHRMRNFFYKKVFLIEMDRHAVIYWGAEIRSSYFLRIGKGSIIGDKALLDARNRIEIGENVNFSSNVSIYTEQHDHRDPYFSCNSDESFRVKIDNRVWVGPNAIILPGVHIGEGAVVAAGSVVTKDIPPFTIVAGIPAKAIGHRNNELIYEFDGRYIPFY